METYLIIGFVLIFADYILGCLFVGFILPGFLFVFDYLSERNGIEACGNLNITRCFLPLNFIHISSKEEEKIIIFLVFFFWAVFIISSVVIIISFIKMVIMRLVVRFYRIAMRAHDNSRIMSEKLMHK